MPHQTYYLDVKVTSAQDPDVISLALVSPRGGWFYAEVVDFDRKKVDAQTMSMVLPKLKRVPGTTFLKGEFLPNLLLKWIVRDTLCAPHAIPPKARVQSAWPAGVELVENMLRNEVKTRTTKVEVLYDTCRVDQALMSDYINHCGGVDKVGNHALVDAMGHAISDLERRTPFVQREYGHLEMLMGSKNASSYRAWLRRQNDSSYTNEEPIAHAVSA